MHAGIRLWNPRTISSAMMVMRRLEMDVLQLALKNQGMPASSPPLSSLYVLGPVGIQPSTKAKEKTAMMGTSLMEMGAVQLARSRISSNV